MPSKSQAQNRAMHAAAASPKTAKDIGIPQKVAKEFVAADKGRAIGKLPQRVAGRGR